MCAADMAMRWMMCALEGRCNDALMCSLIAPVCFCRPCAVCCAAVTGCC